MFKLIHCDNCQNLHKSKYLIIYRPYEHRKDYDDTKYYRWCYDCLVDYQKNHFFEWISEFNQKNRSKKITKKEIEKEEAIVSELIEKNVSFKLKE